MIRNLDRTCWDTVLAFFIVSFCFYLYLTKLSQLQTLNKIFYLGVVLRLAVVFTYPIFSDDFYRFLWDGYLVNEGFSPYALTPASWIHSKPTTENSIRFLFDHMNSKEYYSVYPLMLQAIFVIPWILGLQNLFLQIVCLQLILILFDVLCLYIFKKLRTSAEIYWLYAGNPILILESASQIHFEIIVLFILLYLVSSARAKRVSYVNIFYSLVLQIKINYIFLVPSILIPNQNRKQLKTLGLILISILLLLMTVFFNLQTQLSSGIGLFFHSFRFHSYFEQVLYLFFLPFPNLLYLSGTLSMIIGGIFYLYLLIKYQPSLEIGILLGLLIFILVSPVIHSWYIVPFIGLSLYTQYHISLSILLSIFSALSYLSYGISDPLFSSTLGLFESILIGVYIWKMKPSSFLQKIQS